MTNQTPEARLAAALDTVDQEMGAPDCKWPTARAILATDPTLICPDPAAHEGVTFTVEKLAAALHEADKEPMDDRSDLAAEGLYLSQAREIFKVHVTSTSGTRNVCEPGTADRAEAAPNTTDGRGQTLQMVDRVSDNADNGQQNVQHMIVGRTVEQMEEGL